jgi:hypothetical protein
LGFGAALIKGSAKKSGGEEDLAALAVFIISSSAKVNGTLPSPPPIYLRRPFMTAQAISDRAYF